MKMYLTDCIINVFFLSLYIRFNGFLVSMTTLWLKIQGFGQSWGNDFGTKEIYFVLDLWRNIEASNIICRQFPFVTHLKQLLYHDYIYELISWCFNFILYYMIPVILLYHFRHSDFSYWPWEPAVSNLAFLF